MADKNDAIPMLHSDGQAIIEAIGNIKIATSDESVSYTVKNLDEISDKIKTAEDSAKSAKESVDTASAAMTDAKAYADDASASKSASANSEANAKASETKAFDYSSAALESASEAENSKNIALSYAVGGTNSRPGEDSNNSKYYAEESAKSATESANSATAASDSAKSAADSAEQAKSAIGTITDVMEYGGEVASKESLPTTNNKTGDVKVVTSDNSVFFWNGTKWKTFGSNVGMKPVSLKAASWITAAVPYKYEFGTEYANKAVIVGFDSTSATEEQAEAYTDAQIFGGSGSTLYAWGDAPTVDIPVILYIF